VRHDSFIREAWLIHTWGMTHSYVRHDSFIREAWLIHTWGMTHMRNTLYSYVAYHSHYSSHTYEWGMSHIWVSGVTQWHIHTGIIQIFIPCTFFWYAGLFWLIVGSFDNIYRQNIGGFNWNVVLVWQCLFITRLVHCLCLRLVHYAVSVPASCSLRVLFITQQFIPCTYV